MKKARVLVLVIGIAAIVILVMILGNPYRDPDHIEYPGASLRELFNHNIAAFNRLRDTLPQSLGGINQLWVSQDTIQSPLEWTDRESRHMENAFPQEITSLISAFFEEFHCSRIVWYRDALEITFYPNEGSFCYFYEADARNETLSSSELQDGWYWCIYPSGCTGDDTA